MRYFLCFFPPLATISCGKIGATLLNIILTLMGYIPGVIHAFFVVNRYYADQRHKEMMEVLKYNAEQNYYNNLQQYNKMQNEQR